MKPQGRPDNGEFLEGLDVKETLFKNWVDAIRVNPNQLSSLFSAIAQSSALPAVPAITILPFQLVLGDNKFNALGDWVAEEICRSLSRSNLLTVISHLSSREISRQTIDLTSVRQTLHVDYCVTGSMRVVGDDIIIDADFLDTRSGRILWTRQFSGPLLTFISNSGSSIQNIIRAIGGAIADQTLDYVKDRDPHQVEDQRLLIGGVNLMHRTTLHSFARSREFLEEVIRRLPNSAEAHAWLGKWYVLAVFNGWSTDSKKDTACALDSTARALDIDPNSSFSLTIDGFANNNLLRNLDVAGQRYTKALEEDPNNALSWLLNGAYHAFKDQGDVAVSSVKRARQLSPIDPFGYYFDSLSATALLASDNYQEALDLVESSLANNGRHLSSIRAKITALHYLGRDQDAKTTARNLMARQPEFSITNYLKNHPAAEGQLGQKVAHALKKSGIPN